MRQLLLYTLIAILALACEKETPTPPILNENYTIKVPENPVARNGRLLGYGMSEGEKGFNAAYDKAKQIGFGLTELNLDWTYFEEAQGKYQDPNGLLQAVGFYGTDGVSIGLSFATINTVKRTDPAYLSELNYNDPMYIQAFNDMVDWVMDNIASVDIAYISLGNEVDNFLNGDDWSHFEAFAIEAKQHINSNYPDIPVGVKVTITEGLLGDKKDEVLDMIALSDVALLNYYPQESDFKVYSMEKVNQDFDEILSLVEKQIYFTEIGYQSGSMHANSSEAQQALFYHEMFKFWDEHATQIPIMQINWLHDISQNTLDFYESYYGFSAPGFLEYLGTLGVSNYDHTDKLAFQQLKVDVGARDWSK